MGVNLRKEPSAHVVHKLSNWCAFWSYESNWEEEEHPEWYGIYMGARVALCDAAWVSLVITSPLAVWFDRFADNTGYIPAAAVSVPTSPHAAASYSGFFSSPVVLSSQMLKNAPLLAQGSQSLFFTSHWLLLLKVFCCRCCKTELNV